MVNKNNNQYFVKKFWKDIQTDVSKIEPKFAALVNELNPGEDFPLYLASYPMEQLLRILKVLFYPILKDSL